MININLKQIAEIAIIILLKAPYLRKYKVLLVRACDVTKHVKQKLS